MIPTEYIGRRTNERFTYRRVTFPDLLESEAYGNVISGEVAQSYLSTTRATCSFEFQGGEAPSTRDLVRIWYTFDQQETPLCVGTYVVNYAEVTYTTSNGENVASGSVEGSSILSVLANRIVGYPLTIPSGVKAVSKAIELCNLLELHATENAPTPSTYVTSTSHTFEADDTMLTVVNWLLDAAGYASATCDAYGRVVLEPYKAPNYNEPVYTFANDAKSIIANEVTETNNWSNAQNVVRCYYEDDTASIYAWAKDNTGGKSSLDATAGREITLYENVTELDSTTTAERLTELINHARTKLIDNSTEIMYLEFGIPLVPIEPGQPVEVVKNGESWKLILTNYDIALEVGTQSTAKGRRMVNRQDTSGITSGGEVLWEAEATNE